MSGAKIGILGCGPIGLSVLIPARLEGAEDIYVTDKIRPRLDLAAASGATWTGNPDEQDIVEEIRRREPRLLDAVFECCGEQDALDQAVDILKPGGKLMLVGIPEADRVSFCIDTMRRKEVCIQNVRRQNECVQAAIDLVEDGRVNADAVITHRFGISETKNGFDTVAEYADGVMKAVIDIGGKAGGSNTHESRGS
jgi:threonine dehydrogenase-like Zn-dependent dehydrogenase